MTDVRVALLSVWFLFVVLLLIYYFVRDLMDRYGKKKKPTIATVGKSIYDGEVMSDYNRL